MKSLPKEVVDAVKEIIDNPSVIHAWENLDRVSKKSKLKLFIFDPQPQAVVTEGNILLPENLKRESSDVLGFWVAYGGIKLSDAAKMVMDKPSGEWEQNRSLRDYEQSYGRPTPDTHLLHSEIFSLRAAIHFWLESKKVEERGNRMKSVYEETVDLLVKIDHDKFLDAFVYLYWCDMHHKKLHTWKTENEEKLIRYFQNYVIFDEDKMPDFASDTSYGEISQSIVHKTERVAFHPADLINNLNEALAVLATLHIFPPQELDNEFSQEANNYNSAGSNASAGQDLAKISGRLFSWVQENAIKISHRGVNLVNEDQFTLATNFLTATKRLGELTRSSWLEAFSLHWLGIAARNAKKFDKAIMYFENSLEISMNNSLLHIASGTLDSLGIMATIKSEYQKALSYFEAALRAASESGDLNGKALVLSNRSKALLYHDRLDEARRDLIDALDIIEKLDNPSAKAAILDNLGDIEHRLGNHEAAIDHIRESIDIFTQLKADKDCYLALVNLASTYKSLGKVEISGRVFKDANTIIEGVYSRLEIDKYRDLGPEYFAPRKWQKQQDERRDSAPIDRTDREVLDGFFKRFGVAIVDLAAQKNSEEAAQAFHRGNLDTALSLGLQAANEFKSIGYDLPLAETLTNLSHTYSRLGDTDRAIECSEEALNIYSGANFLWGEISSRINLYRALVNSSRIGAIQDAYIHLVVADKLTEFFAKLHDISKKSDLYQGYLRAKGAILTNRANVATKYGAFDLALDWFKQALDIARKTDDKYRICVRALNLAGLYGQISNDEMFHRYLNESFIIARELDGVDVLIQCTSYKIRFLEKSHSSEDLVKPILEWLDLVERLRLEAPNIELRSLIKGDVYPLFGLAIRVARDTNSPEMLWDFMERIKARAALDSVSLVHAIGVDLNGEFANLIDEEQRLTARQRELDQILYNPMIEESDDAIRIRFEARTEREKTCESLNVVRVKVAAIAPTYLRWRRGAPVLSDQINELLELEKDALFLNYYVFSDGFVVVAASRKLDEIRLYEYHDESAQFGAILQSIENEISSMTLSPIKKLTETSSVLLMPVKELLESEEFSIMIVALDGFLLNLPFSILPCSGRMLIDKYEVIQLPNTSMYYYLHKRLKKESVSPSSPPLVFGNPSEDLKFAEEEARIVAEVLNGDLCIREKCTKETLFSMSGNSPVLHLACHGYFDVDSVEGSGLLLADGSVITASDIRKLKLSNPLVTLSACESGKMKSLEGNELMGLAISFLEAGASSVIVSLWKVDDQSTMLLMKNLYMHWIKGNTLSSSLRYAQCWLRRQIPEYDRPYFWAPFIIVGANLKFEKQERMQ